MDTPSRLRLLAPQTQVTVGGRVVAAQGREFALADAFGHGTIRWNGEPPRLGQWAIAHGRWTGDCVEATSVEGLGTPARFPGGDSDWGWIGTHGRADALAGRARILCEVRAHFQAQGYVEVETPAIVASPGMDSHIDAFEVLGAGGPRWLITSPEYQMKRLLSAGLPRIFQLARCFRRGEQGTRHEPEFTMLEWYRAFATFDALLVDTEMLVESVCRRVTGSACVTIEGRSVDLTPPWDRITVREAFARYASADADALLADQESFFRTFVGKVEPALGHDRACFLTHWPIALASNAIEDPGNPGVALRMEAYVAGMELCNGFEEITDATTQRARFESELRRRETMGVARYPVDERLLDALATGLPPCVGNALGIDRLVMMILGRSSIDDVVAIPSHRGH